MHTRKISPSGNAGSFSVLLELIISRFFKDFGNDSIDCRLSIPSFVKSIFKLMILVSDKLGIDSSVGKLTKINEVKVCGNEFNEAKFSQLVIFNVVVPSATAGRDLIFLQYF